MTLLDRPDNRLFIGKGGSGKSHLIRYQLKKSDLAVIDGKEKRWKRDRIVLFDTNGEKALGEMADQIVFKKIDLINVILNRKRFIISFRGFQEYGKAAFEDCNEVCLAAENITVVWEELEFFTNSKDLPNFAHQICHAGRHQGMRIMATSRAPAMIPKNFTRNVQEISIFHTDEPNDIKYLSEKIGSKSAQDLPKLQKYHCLHWSDRTGATVRKSPFT